MNLEQRVIAASDDKKLRGELITEYTNFILSATSKVVKRPVTAADDVFSVGLIAFDEAVVNFKPEKGSFLSFAALVIRNRLTDYLRKEAKHSKSLPFSSFSMDDGEGGELSFDTPDTRHSLTDDALEMRFLIHELEHYNIKLEDVYKAMPSYSSTRETCMKAAMYIASCDELYRSLRAKKTLPVKRLVAETGINEKIFERYRKYIIAAVLIFSR